MKLKFTIASFNVQNPYMKKNIDLDKEMFELSKIVKEKNIDILCCQEMLIDSTKILSKYLPDYFIVGKSRYGRHLFSKNISILKKYNELTPIISCKKIVTCKHYHLPWLPKSLSDIKNGIKKRSLTPRTLTEANIEIEPNYVFKIFNTHLDKGMTSVRRRQLEVICHISKNAYPLVITGDFNAGLSDKDFQKFVNHLKKYNLKHISIDTSTLKNRKNRIIDHIFVPNDWQVLETKIVNNSISDHYMLLIKVEVKIC